MNRLTSKRLSMCLLRRSAAYRAKEARYRKLYQSRHNYLQKLRRLKARQNAKGTHLCSLCYARPAKTHVTRLVIRPDDRFQEVSLPYCGIC